MTIIKKFDPVEEKSIRLPKKYIVLVVFSFFILTIINIWASNTVVSYGDKFENLSNMSRKLQTENQVLQNQIAKNISLNNVASKSAELGFLKTESIQYIR